MSNHDFYLWDDELSEREAFLIGKSIAQWGALENEIFVQTLMTFEDKDVALPKAMNNLQFTEILELWKERVVAKAEQEQKNVLAQQYEKILKLKDYRDALVHGMWQWSKNELSKITSVRIRKKEIISVHFAADDLADFSLKLARINFKLRFPGGVEDLAEQRAAEGFYISRLGAALFTGAPIAEDWLKATGITVDDEKED
ncbi:MAG TPA: hypothetical protein VN114_11220 [Oxalicibacterium sp.]|uniref:hypothetical protein n=1 Tax=Oxalicibacterium sp. TaxID=2766525 RepID=UPI002B89FA6E|nr:hypothetical protein [Oxalicibacterium sp.]HWU99075.1 hypothetical protein [Oxalicibacterium sp.]